MYELTPRLCKYCHFCPFLLYLPPLQGGRYIVFLLIIIFLPPFFKTTPFGKLTIYPNDIWYQVLVKQQVFKNHPPGLNPIPLQSYLPLYEKPCQRFSEETVKDIYIQSFELCSLTNGATLQHLIEMIRGPLTGIISPKKSQVSLASLKLKNRKWQRPGVF